MSPEYFRQNAYSIKENRVTVKNPPEKEGVKTKKNGNIPEFFQKFSLKRAVFEKN